MSLNSKLLVLASSSPYRSELLRRLQIPFETAVPGIDEQPGAGESAHQTACRLSLQKAQAVAANYPKALIIGSDQVVMLGDKQFGKPLTHENAVFQLRQASGHTVRIYTALTLLNAESGVAQTRVAENQVTFRDLSEAEIESYLRREQPYQCAGSVKTEGLGITLISRIEGDDPNALIGLPLIMLVNMLRQAEWKIL